MPDSRGPFSLPTGAAGTLRHRVMRLVAPPAERGLGLAALNEMHRRLRRGPETDGDNFFTRALESIDVRLELDAHGPGGLPARGPVVVVANHPFGAVEGLLLGALLRRIRPDVRLLANHMLAVIPEIRPWCIFVDPFDGPRARDRNVGPLREAVHWLRGGGALGVFPAGEVAHATWRRPLVSDPPWSDTIGRLVLRVRVPAVPVHFEGRTGLGLQAAGLVHPRLRTALLPRELLRHRGACRRARVGALIDPARLAEVGDAGDVTSYLRVRTYMLRERGHRVEPRPAGIGVAPIEPGHDPDALAVEVDALPGESRLLAKGDDLVLVAEADRIPLLLHEIGRQRERAFRLVGEATGRSIDIDRFDATYLHLFIWNCAEREVVGAYRLGPTDRILASDGIEGLYTSTLFRYRRRLLEQLDPALELGRSFVRPERQRSYAALLLLWRGIGCFLARHPRYRRLFGPVSISRDYQSMSRRLLLAFLEHHRFLPSLGALLRPRTPVRLPPLRDWDRRDTSVVVRDLDEVDRLIRELESEARGIPVLLRQYLKLHARIIGFNVDPDFGDVIDALIVTDMAEVHPRLLRQYMGRERAEAFLRHHGAARRTQSEGRVTRPPR